MWAENEEILILPGSAKNLCPFKNYLCLTKVPGGTFTGSARKNQPGKPIKDVPGTSDF